MRPAVALWLVAGACAEPEAIGARAQPIVDGVETDDHPAVVAVAWDGRVRCSGVVVGPRAVATAAHCLRPDLPTVITAADPQAGGAPLAVVGQLVHPDHDRLGAPRDLALLILAAPVAIAPVPLASDPAAVAVGAPLRVVGYGHTGPGADGAQRRRTGTVRVVGATDAVVTAVADPALVCHGDSGGAALTVDAGGPRLAGVVADVGVGCAGEAVLARIDPVVDSFFAPWLRALVDGGTATGGRCWVDAQCAAGACLPAGDQPAVGFCAAACARDADCPVPMACDDGQCRHPAPSPGGFASACTVDDDCHAGRCLAVGPDGAARCSARCVPGGDTCGAAATCVETAAGGDYGCAPAATAGCAIGAPADGLVPVGLALALARLLARRRRARS